VCWRAVVVELRRFTAIDAGEYHFFGALAHIQRIAMTDLVALTVNGNGARTADVDHAQFTTLQEVAHAKLFADFTAHGDGFCDRHDAAHNDAVNVAVHHGVLIRDKHFLN
jgi:hypothetical protein